MDRALREVLALPFFPNEFRRTLGDLGLLTVEHFVAFGAENVDQFFDMLSEMAPALLGSHPRPQEVLHRIVDEVDDFKLFWLLLMAAKERFLFTSAASMGFGMIGTTAPLYEVLGTPCKKRLVSTLLPDRIYAIKGSEAPACSSLLQSEVASKAKWLDRMEAIARRAGQAASINNANVQSSELTAADRSRKGLHLVSGPYLYTPAHPRVSVPPRTRWACTTGW